MMPRTHIERVLSVLARLRFVLAVAGVAWLFGYTPSIGGRITVGVVVLLVLMLDAAAGAFAEPRVNVSLGRKSGGAA